VGEEIRVGGLDLLWDGGPIYAPCPGQTEYGPILKGSSRDLNLFLGQLLIILLLV
jgi:hypothetical protein